jgi:hypothetical protein
MKRFSVGRIIAALIVVLSYAEPLGYALLWLLDLAGRGLDIAEISALAKRLKHQVLDMHEISYLDWIWFAFGFLALIYLAYDVWGKHLKHFSVSGSTNTRNSRANDSDSGYQQRILSIAKAHQEAVQGRLLAAKARLERGDLDRMVGGMSLERVSCLDLINVDQERLSLIQINLLSKYKFRENELRVYIDELGMRNYSKEKSVSSFIHRLRKLSEALDNLIENWNKTDIER